MHAGLALAVMIAAVAPQNEERDDDAIAAKVLVIVATSATGALLGATLAGGTSLLALGDACAQERCVDNPQFVVTPLATAAGGVVGGVVGAIAGVFLGFAVADALPATTPQSHTPLEEFPDD